jgi:excisionase family DNA binding protein
METICKTLSNRERKTAKLKARLEHEQSAVPPAIPLPEPKPTSQRAHRVRHRHGSRDSEAAPDSEALAFCVEEAAHLIGVSRATIYVLIASGDLRTIKIRKRRIVELLAVGAA